jgi:hypothetical protein
MTRPPEEHAMTAKPVDSSDVASQITDVLTALRARDGDELVYRYAAANVEATTVFLLRALGPVASRKALLSAVAALDAAFERENGASEYLQ